MAPHPETSAVTGPLTDAIPRPTSQTSFPVQKSNRRPNPGPLTPPTAMAKTKSATKITPIGDRVVIKRVEAEDTTKGGIILPDSAKEKPREGIVLALGSGRLLKNGERAPFSVKVDDRVLFSSYAGTEVKVDGEEIVVLSEDEILAIVG